MAFVGSNMGEMPDSGEKKCKWSICYPLLKVFEVKRQMRSVSDVGSHSASAAYSNGSAVPGLDRERSENAVVV